VSTAQIGGDWYDAFALPDDALALVVGDVAGHDVSAAVGMSQLRNLLRAVA
jgi:serine phosphatase RsbU (regulator of sigma subunit)